MTKPKAKKKAEPKVKVWAVCDGIQSRIAWERYPYSINGFGELKTPEVGDQVHTIMHSGFIEVFEVVEILAGSGRAKYEARVKRLGYLNDLEPDNV